MKKEFSRLKHEEIDTKEKAEAALLALPEDTYRRLKGKMLSVIEELKLEEEVTVQAKAKMVSLLKMVANNESNLVKAVISALGK